MNQATAPATRLVFSVVDGVLMQAPADKPEAKVECDTDALSKAERLEAFAVWSAALPRAAD
jgi:hypothetical protein